MNKSQIITKEGILLGLLGSAIFIAFMLLFYIIDRLVGGLIN